tara:strand:- start:112 stop:1311 length:1200 start_codon:yes stop_codon:yes gene_type:complete
MAATETGVWNLQDVRDKQLAGEWSYTGANHLLVTGTNDEGMLGLNQSPPGNKRSSPTQIPGTNWNKALNNSTPGGFGMAGKSDGTLWTWGRNEYGEQGSGDRTYRSSPTQVGTDTTWAVGLARDSNQGGFCMKTDGTYWIWGRNVYGSLGLNQPHPTKISSPAQLPGTDWPYNDATKIACGNNGQQLAIKTNGELWGWGLNSNGALASNNRTQRSSPVQIGSENTWSAVTAGQSVCAIKTDGTLWAWSSNDRGQLGLNQGGDGDSGDGPRLSSPAQVGTDTTWSRIATGPKQQAAIKTDGTLWTWGRNNYGELGQNNNSTAVSSPTQVGTDTDWHSVSMSYGVMAARKTNGELWVTGRNANGQLAQNNVIYRSSPVQVPGTWAEGFKASNLNLQLLQEQ